jgi:hypothetical protein
MPEPYRYSLTAADLVELQNLLRMRVEMRGVPMDDLVFDLLRAHDEIHHLRQYLRDARVLVDALLAERAERTMKRSESQWSASLLSDM